MSPFLFKIPKQLTLGWACFAFIDTGSGAKTSNNMHISAYLVNIWPNQVIQFVENAVNHFDEQMSLLVFKRW